MWPEEKKLQRVMGIALGLSPEEIGPLTNQDTVKAWDSLKQMNLILMLEEEFGITIPDDEAANLTSYPLVRLVLEELLGVG